MTKVQDLINKDDSAPKMTKVSDLIKKKSVAETTSVDSSEPVEQESEVSVETSEQVGQPEQVNVQAESEFLSAVPKDVENPKYLSTEETDTYEFLSEREKLHKEKIAAENKEDSEKEATEKLGNTLTQFSVEEVEQATLNSKDKLKATTKANETFYNDNFEPLKSEYDALILQGKESGLIKVEDGKTVVYDNDLLSELQEREVALKEASKQIEQGEIVRQNDLSDLEQKAKEEYARKSVEGSGWGAAWNSFMEGGNFVTGTARAIAQAAVIQNFGYSDANMKVANKFVDENIEPNVKGAIEAVQTGGTTKEYIQESKKDNLIQEAGLSLMESGLPIVATMANPTLGYAALYGQSAEAIHQSIKDNKNLTEGEKAAYSFVGGAISAALEKAGIDIAVGNNKLVNAVTQKYLKYAIDNGERITLANAARFATQVGIRGVGEGTVEAVQQGADLAQRAATNFVKGKEILDVDTIREEGQKILHAGVVGTIAGTMMSAPIAMVQASTTNKLDPTVFKAGEKTLKDPSYLKDVKGVLDTKLEKGEITEEQHTEYMADAELAVNTVNEIDPDLPEGKRQKGFELLIELDGIEKATEGKKVVSPEKTKRKEEIEDELKSMSSFDFESDEQLTEKSKVDEAASKEQLEEDDRRVQQTELEEEIYELQTMADALSDAQGINEGSFEQSVFEAIGHISPEEAVKETVGRDGKVSRKGDIDPAWIFKEGSKTKGKVQTIDEAVLFAKSKFDSNKQTDDNSSFDEGKARELIIEYLKRPRAEVKAEFQGNEELTAKRAELRQAKTNLKEFKKEADKAKKADSKPKEELKNDNIPHIEAIVNGDKTNVIFTSNGNGANRKVTISAGKGNSMFAHEGTTVVFNKAEMLAERKINAEHKAGIITRKEVSLKKKELYKEVFKRALKEQTETKETPNTQITPENSANFANLTEDDNGNFVFFHVGDKGYKTVNPAAGGKKGATSQEEASAIGKVGGVAMYYTSETEGEQQVQGDGKYAVSVPKDKVYDADTDPLNLTEAAKELHEKEYPNSAFNDDTRVAYVTKLAGEQGFEMVVSEWNGRTRAQTTKAFTPSDTQELDGNKITKPFKSKYKGNKEKGYKSVIPESKRSVLQKVYDKIGEVRNKAAKYDELYRLRTDAHKFSQEEITEMIENSDISQELKDEYKAATEYKEGKRTSKAPIEKKKSSLFGKPVAVVKEIANKFKKAKGIKSKSGSNITEIDVDYSKKIADAYDKMKHNPNNPKVKEAYEAMAKETLEQYEAITKGGVVFEIYKDKGEPYATSKEMLADLEKGHLYVLSTESDFGEAKITDRQRKENPLLRDSGIKDKNGETLLVNDVFRGVHDFFGHGERGNSFGAKGEENAWDVHSRMYSPKARAAMTTETRGQNSWVNFGKQMRNEDGSIKKKGDKGYMSPTERPFAEQKIGLLPAEFLENKYETKETPVKEKTGKSTEEKSKKKQPPKPPSKPKVETREDGKKERAFAKKSREKGEEAGIKIDRTEADFYTPERQAEVEANISKLKESDLEKLARDKEAKTSVRVAAGIELINRAYARGENPKEIRDLFSEMGTDMGQAIAMYARLKTATPEGIVNVILDQVESTGRKLTDKKSKKAKVDLKKPKSDKTYKEAAAAVSKAVRKAKFTQTMSDLNKLQSDPLGVFKGAWDGTVEIFATTIDATGDIFQAVEDAVVFIKGTEWYQNLSEKGKTEAEKIVRRDLENQALKQTETGKELTRVRKKLQDNKSQLEKLRGLAENLINSQQEYAEIGRRVASGEDVSSAELKEAQKYAEDSMHEMNKFTGDVLPSTWGEKLSMTIQGSLLTPLSLIKNPIYNLFRLPIQMSAEAIGETALTITDIAKSLSRLVMGGDAVVNNRKKLFSLAAYAYALKHGAPKGIKEAIGKFAKGKNIADVDYEYQQSRGFMPMRAWLGVLTNTKIGDALGVDRDIMAVDENGKVKMGDRLKKLYDGTFGIAPELMFRLLPFGDTPFHRLIETKDLYLQAKAKGLKGDALKRFIQFPPKNAAEAAKVEAAKAVFQEDSPASKLAQKLVSSPKNLSRSPLINNFIEFAVRTQFPYVKTPVNVINQTADFALPPLSLGKAIYHASNGNYREAYEYLGKAITGGIMIEGAAVLIGNGLVTGALYGSDDYDEKKQRGLAYSTQPPNTINISGLKRMINGGDPTWQDGDKYSDYRTFGFFGSILGMQANSTEFKNRLKAKEGRRKVVGAEVSNVSDVMTMYGDVPEMVRYALDQSFLTGTATLLKAATGSQREVDNWLKGTFKAASSIVLPNTLTQVNRARTEYMPDLRGKDKAESFKNIILDKTFQTDELPVRYDLGGNPIRNTPKGKNPYVHQLLDPFRSGTSDSSPEFKEIYDVFKETEDIRVIPQMPKRSFPHKGEIIVMDTREYNDFVRDRQRYTMKELGDLFDRNSYSRKPSDKKSEKIQNELSKINSSSYVKRLKRDMAERVSKREKKK